MGVPLLSVVEATRVFDTPGGELRALDTVSLSLERGETLGIVGESGSGKSTLGRAIVGLQPLSSGDILLDGSSWRNLPADRLRAARARVQMVFQDPAGSLNPRHTVGRILEEPLIVHRRGSRAERCERVAWALTKVGFSPDMAQRHPNEFSGGQRQRISIARALILAPDIIVCDEAVSGLDVSVRAQVLNLLNDLRSELGLANLFISHDLAVVRHMSDRIAVLYAGRLVETADTADFWAEPLHPYSQLLMRSIPSIHNLGGGKRLSSNASKGNDSPPSGCAFRFQCPLASDLCARTPPSLRRVEGGREVACHRVN